MKIFTTALLATTAICMVSTQASAAVTHELNGTPLEGASITANNDGSGGEPFFITHGGSGSNPGANSNQVILQGDNSIGGGNDQTLLQNLDNVVINSDSDGSGNSSVALQVNGHTGLEVHGNGSGGLGSVTIDGSTGGTSITGSGGFSTTGGAASLNASSNFNTNINTGTSSGAVAIGNNSAGGNVGITSSGTNAVNINAGTGAATVTNIGTGNTTGNINIGNGTNSGAISIGNSLSTNNITGVTNVNTSGNKATNIGTGGTGVVNIGNTTGGTAVTGPLTVTAPNGSGGSNTLSVGATQTTTVGVNNVTYGTAVNGGMLVNGDLGVNGNIYSLNPTANATVNVANNGLNITGSTNTVGLVSDNNSSSADGRAAVTLTPTTANVQVTNSLGNVHGLAVGTTNTVLSGGTNSTTMTLDDSGATFRNTSTGGPARVRGVADGKSRYDAVNFGQLENIQQKSSGGIASVSAMSNIPQVDQGQKFSLGMGYGYFDSENAFALGGSVRVDDAAIVKASFGSSTNGDKTVGAGVAYSW